VLINICGHGSEVGGVHCSGETDLFHEQEAVMVSLIPLRNNLKHNRINNFVIKKIISPPII
jgi:hypothetical protein